MPPPVGKRAISIAFVCPSVCPFVCPSVAYIRLANNSRTQRPSTPNLEGRFPTFDVTRIPVWRSKGPKIKATRSTNADTHRAPYLPNGKAYELQMEDDKSHQPQAPQPPRLKLKVARSRDQSEPSWPNAVPVSPETCGGIPCRPNPAATLLVLVVNRTDNRRYRV